ncbi:hypothetical protein QYF36_008677 [Acer negundo]|nr:hypothetical protein QYF36_008677 [Acer negundo]
MKEGEISSLNLKLKRASTHIMKGKEFHRQYLCRQLEKCRLETIAVELHSKMVNDRLNSIANEDNSVTALQSDAADQLALDYLEGELATWLLEMFGISLPVSAGMELNLTEYKMIEFKLDPLEARKLMRADIWCICKLYKDGSSPEGRCDMFL